MKIPEMVRFDTDENVKDIFFKHYIYAATNIFHKSDEWVEGYVYEYLEDNHDWYMEEQSILAQHWKDEKEIYEYAYAMTTNECCQLLKLSIEWLKLVEKSKRVLSNGNY